MMERTENDPGGGGGEIEDIDNWVLVSIDSWVRSGLPKDNVIEKIMSLVSLAELRDAASILRKGKWGAEVGRVPQEGDPEYPRNLAGAVFKGLLSIQNVDCPKVKFWVSSNDLLKVPGARQYLEDQLDSQAVAARLAGVDAQMGLMMEKLKATEQLEVHVVELARTVTELKAELKEAHKVYQQQTGTMKEAAGAFEKAATTLEQAGQRQVAPGQSWAEKVAGSHRQGRVRTLQASGRERSVSRKRSLEDDDRNLNASQRPRIDAERELYNARGIRSSHPAPLNSALSQSLSSFAAEAQEGFVEVRQKRRRGGTAKGSSNVEADGGEKLPYSIFLSGTSTSTDEAIVKEKLSACYAALSSGVENEVPRTEFKVLKVELIPLNIPEGETPRSKCWKVTVAPEFAAHMARGEAYPQAWSWRKWHPGPRTPKGKTSAADGRA